MLKKKRKKKKEKEPRKINMIEEREIVDAQRVVIIESPGTDTFLLSLVFPSFIHISYIEKESSSLLSNTRERTTEERTKERKNQGER